MRPTYVLRHMRVEDIPQVLEIDALSFPSPWSARTYQFEISNHDTSYLSVLETTSESTPPTNRWQRMFRWLRGSQPSAEGRIVGYAGCWLIAGEAHISTIAVHPGYRGKGLGEVLLAGMLRRSLRLGGEYSVLEVRTSNAVAQALYRKYEYEISGVRRNYYRDNNEDAYLMEVRPLDVGYHARFGQRYEALRQRVAFADRFTEV
ncbi:MAG: ribosomal protein S18-alanine N-acetyltransferase [Chloroflexi bacterium]|nr:ribosomal protein S18-alanine N-acetyltransferase [Chloroflexota bacterium]